MRIPQGGIASRQSGLMGGQSERIAGGILAWIDSWGRVEQDLPSIWGRGDFIRGRGAKTGRCGAIVKVERGRDWMARPTFCGWSARADPTDCESSLRKSARPSGLGSCDSGRVQRSNRVRSSLTLQEVSMLSFLTVLALQIRLGRTRARMIPRFRTLTSGRISTRHARGSLTIPDEAIEEARRYRYVFVGGFHNERLPGYFAQNARELRAKGVPKEAVHLHISKLARHGGRKCAGRARAVRGDCRHRALKSWS